MQIHWFSIVNSILSVLLLTAILITIFMRTLRHDFARFTTDETPLDDDECGWKYIHADVFRFPRHKSFFCALVGAGSQLLGLCVAIFTLALGGVYPFCVVFLPICCKPSPSCMPNEHFPKETEQEYASLSMLFCVCFLCFVVWSSLSPLQEACQTGTTHPQ